MISSFNAIQKKSQVFPGAKKLLEGSTKDINPQLPLVDQTELLSYDKRWEFPKCHLRLGWFELNSTLSTSIKTWCVCKSYDIHSGMQLGAGCFGRVVKAEAVGITKGSDESVQTVAVKMVRSQTNITAMEALISEMKILIYLGTHLNVVNLLGACTKQISKGFTKSEMMP